MNARFKILAITVLLLLCATTVFAQPEPPEGAPLDGALMGGLLLLGGGALALRKILKGGNKQLK